MIQVSISAKTGEVTESEFNYTPEQIAAQLVQDEENRVLSIKEEAKRRIIALVPEWTAENHTEKQRNALMKASVLINKKADGGVLTTAESGTVTSYLTISNAIELIRAASNEAELNGTALVDIIWP